MSGAASRSGDLERKLHLVAQTGLLLARNTHLETIVQRAADAGLQLTDAQFGAFLLNIGKTPGGSYPWYTVQETDGSRSSTFLPMPTGGLGPPLRERSILRSRDIGRDSRYQGPLAHDGLPHDTRLIRSYLAVPVRSLGGELLGEFVFGHEEADIFGEDAELFIGSLATQAAVSIENGRLREQLSKKIADLEQTERKQKAAVKRLGELAAIVESSDDAIISKDLNGIITSWNEAAARIFGYASDEIVGQSVLKLIPEDLQSDEPVILSKIRAGERIEHFETLRKAKNGDSLEVSLTISPVRDDSGEIVGASKILRDISGRKRMEHSLVQAEKIAATGRMAATIAHEINNPLEAVLNLLYLLRGQVDTPEGRTYLSTAEIELTRVAHIAKQTLGYYREHASATPCTLSHLAEHALSVYGPRCSAYGISVERALASDTKVVLRRGEILQVISNLIANALNAMPEGGRLKIESRDVQDPEPGVVLSIEDNGVGIPKENRRRVFDAFFTTRATIGTGIGLFVAKQFIEGHGGRISLESSVDPGVHGTKVLIGLPLHTVYEAKAGDESGPTRTISERAASARTLQ